MKQEQEERQFTATDRNNLRQIGYDILELADDDLRNSGQPKMMFEPFRAVYQSLIRAGVAYAKAHPEATDPDAAAEVNDLLDAGFLDPEGVASVPDPKAIVASLFGMEPDYLSTVLMEETGSNILDMVQAEWRKRIEFVADALDTAFKAGAGAPPSHGSAFNGLPVRK